MFEVLAIKIFNLFCIFCTSTVVMIGDVLFFFTFFHLKFGFLKLFNYICLVRLFERIAKKKLKKKSQKIWKYKLI